MICFYKSQPLAGSNSMNRLTETFQLSIRLADHLDRLKHLGPHRNHPVADHLDLLGGNHTKVEDPPLGVGAPVIDPHDDALPVPEIGHPDLGVEREFLVGGGAVGRMVVLAVSGQPSDPATPVEGGLSRLHGDRFGIVEGRTGVGFHHGATGEHHGHKHGNKGNRD